MGTADLVRARDRLLTAIADDLPVADVLQAMVASLHDVALFDACAMLLTDPETMLPSAGVVEGFPLASCGPFWDNELLDPDFMKFNALARSTEPVATLYQETDGDLGRSPRYQKLFAHTGADDELRVAFTAGSTCWAVAALVRPAGAGPFTTEEVHAVRQVVPVATRALRHAVGSLSGSHSVAGPAMLVVDADGRIESMTTDAEAILHDLRTHGLDGMVTPTAVMAAALRAKSSRSESRVALRAQGLSGRWLKLHASPLGTDGRVAVMIEPARPVDLVPILLEYFGMTERETEVVFLLARGLSTKEIAAELCISTHTVNDHIKVIFTKAGVSSRGELVARLFADYVREPYRAAVAHL
jgi:DNA-binding CsgD family transcriptional regulator